ncbi:mitochondrial 54S ribosomal protein YmL35 [Parelaphostrongylus tenuis]|uniref:Mitochondrial 54S ribosomal protein YmL35 n=1 Tax=Parelaphostrongylus tenuis TaxID=148309 RepID=A0AAD5MZT8_PARTN|nr:mitochondrial 54S ribosomal protein YmL35 [Parelaphostrongylus tenuis]
MEERYDAQRIPRARRTHWASLARDREKWKSCWYPLESLDDQRDDRMLPSCRKLLAGGFTLSEQSARTIARIPHYEYHIRFSPKDGRKRPSQDVLDRFKRLNNGMWIRAHPGKHRHRYMKDKVFEETSLYLETCTKEECQMLDKMMTPFWLRPHHYPNDPYAPYHVRHGVDSPRVDDKGRLLRERKKILLDDITADRYFGDR